MMNHKLCWAALFSATAAQRERDMTVTPDLKGSPAPSRFHVLPPTGTLLVSADLHGNGDDFRALRSHFMAMMKNRPDCYWLLLGDLVHGPDPSARQRDPELYDFEDESWNIVKGVADLQGQYPDRVLLILGNHDYSQVGGPHTSKFWPDETTHLEAQLDPQQRDCLRGLFNAALLVVAAPCGLLFAHGSPGSRLQTPEQLFDIDFGSCQSGEEADLLCELLTSYGQRGPVTEALLFRMSKATGLDLRLVVHGHDRDPSGFFAEGGNQAQAVVFGAPKHNKRYLEFDLSKHYSKLADLREGIEIRRLHSTR